MAEAVRKMEARPAPDREPKPAYFACREALTPLMANIRTDRWKFFSDEKMKCEFWICNDTQNLPVKPVLAWELEVDGKIVHARREPAEVKPVEAVFQGFTAIPVPEVARRTPGNLRLALFDGDRLVHDTSIDVEFFPKPKPVSTAVQVVGGKDGPAARLARGLDLRVRTDAQVFLIDDYEAYQKRRAEIDGAVEQGARAIFLNLPRGAYVLPGSTDRVSIQAANPHFLSRDTRHPLVAGFEPFDFRLWFDEKEDMITPLANGKFGGAGWDTILKAQGINAVAERAAGRGRVILCEAFLSDRIGANPPARIFADRLLTEK